MKYQKPAIFTVGNAVRAIEASLSKNDAFTEGVQMLPSIDAYQADE